MNFRILFSTLCATAVPLVGCTTAEPMEPTEPYFECYLWLDDVCIEGEWKNTPLDVVKKYDATGL